MSYVATARYATFWLSRAIGLCKNKMLHNHQNLKWRFGRGALADKALWCGRMLLAGLLVLPARQGMADEFPKILVRSYQKITALPDSHGFILEVRDTATIMQPEIGIFDLDADKEMVWQLPNTVLVPNDALYGAAWAPLSRQLFLMHMGALQVLESNGTYKEVVFKTLGGAFANNPLTRYADVKRLAVSPDGKSISYSFYTRDEHDGLFTDLMVQQLTPEALPRSLASPSYDYLSAWSPDGKALAFNTREGQIEVKDLEGKTHLMVDVPGRVFQIQWSPDGTKIGLSLDQKFWSLDVMTGALHRSLFDRDDKADVREFAWSPDGNSLAFRSSFESGRECSVSPGYYFETGSMPCRSTFYLYIAQLDGRKALKRISSVKEMRPGPLFWVPATAQAGVNQRTVQRVVALPPAITPKQRYAGLADVPGNQVESRRPAVVSRSIAPGVQPGATPISALLQPRAAAPMVAPVAQSLVSVDGKIYLGGSDCINQKMIEWAAARPSPPTDTERGAQLAVTYRHCKADAFQIPLTPQGFAASRPGASTVNSTANERKSIPGSQPPDSYPPGNSAGQKNTAVANLHSFAGGSQSSERSQPAASGAIYRCVSASGQVTFSGASCGPDAKRVDARPATTP